MRPDTIELGPEGARYRIRDPGGGGRVATVLRTGSPYEPGVLRDMVSLKASGVAIDVGANIGNHTLWLAAVCGLHVEAFEPIRHEDLRKNLALNDSMGDQVRVHCVALGREPGVASQLRKGRLRTGVGDIEVRALDEFRFTNVSILKIDVEGMEADVIQGGLETIARERPVIYSEAWDDEYLQATASLLEPLNYRHAQKLRVCNHRWDP